MSPRACPICDRLPAVPEYAPFCSKRCADIDLQRWFSGAYAVPAADITEEAESALGEAGRTGDDPL